MPPSEEFGNPIGRDQAHEVERVPKAQPLGLGDQTVAEVEGRSQIQNAAARPAFATIVSR